MWSLKKINLTAATRTIRQSLLQQDKISNSPQKQNFNALGRTKIAPNQKQIKSAQNEFLAIIKLLERSSINSLPMARHLSTSIRLFEKASDKNQSEKQDQAQSSDSSNNQNDRDAEQSSDGKKPGEKQTKKSKKKVQKPEDFNNWNRIMAFITNSILWTALIYGIGFAFFIIMSIVSGKNEYQNSERYVISWKEFVQYMLAAGEVKELIVRPQYDYVKVILHDGAIINGRRSRYPMYLLQIPNVDHFEKRLREVEKHMGISESIPIRYERINEAYGKLFAAVVLIAIIALIMKNVKVKMGGMASSAFSMGKAKVTVIENGMGKGVYFKDVAGLKEAKQEVIEFVDYLKRPARYQALGARVPKGALLLGPPGCGKTLLAKAVATEAGVPFLTMNGSEFIEMIGGLGAARVRDLFKKAAKKAPCIIYIDEIDAIGRQRSNTSTPTSGESEQTLNQLLVELDGMASKEGILMLASTNRADVLDKALLRPGRFDRHIEIDLPTLEERIEIFEKHLSGVTLEKRPSDYSRRLAILSPGFSGADIANVCNEAALHAARFSKSCVSSEDLEYAIERSVGGTEKRSNSLSEEERRTVAYHESGHALVGWLLENSDVLQKVTIVPRTNMALGFAQYRPHDQKLFTKEQLIDKIRMALGGRAAENITFLRITTGAQNDLDKVTKIAFAMVAKYGMGETLGPMYVPDEPEQQHPWFAVKPFSNALNNTIDLETRKIITDAYFYTEKILKMNRDKLVTLAEALLKQETLNYDQVVELIGPPKYESAKRKIDPVEFEQSLNSLSRAEDGTGAEETANAK